MAVSKTIAIVFGRHTQRPHIEGGGKVMLNIASVLADTGVETLFITFNYYNPYHSFTIYSNSRNRISYREANIVTKFITQDIVLNTRFGALAANIIELCKASLYIASTYPRFTLNNNIYERALVFIGNASKYLSIILQIIDRILGF